MHLILASNRVECCPEPFQMQAATGNLVVKLGVILVRFQQKQQKIGFLGGSKKNRGYFWGYFSINSKIKSL